MLSESYVGKNLYHNLTAFLSFLLIAIKDLLDTYLCHLRPEPRKHTNLLRNHESLSEASYFFTNIINTFQSFSCRIGSKYCFKTSCLASFYQINGKIIKNLTYAPSFCKNLPGNSVPLKNRTLS